MFNRERQTFNRLFKLLFEYFQKCDDSFCPLNQKCIALTSLECECKDGFLSTGLGICSDVDECVNESQLCSNGSKCVNTDGSYDCFESTTLATTTDSTTTTTDTTSTTTKTNQPKVAVLVLNSYGPPMAPWKPASGFLFSTTFSL